jgi:hypothetical protein
MDNTDSYSGSATRAQVYPSEGGVDTKVDTKSATREVAQDARRRGFEVVDKAAHEAQRVADHFREQAGGALGEGRTQLAAQIGGVARALKASSRQLRQDELGGLASLSDGLAEQVEAVQHYLSEQDSAALLGDLKTFARRRRGLFVGSLLFAGLLAARFAQTGTSEGQEPATRAQTRESSAPARSGSAAPSSRGGVRTYPRGRA